MRDAFLNAGWFSAPIHYQLKFSPLFNCNHSGYTIQDINILRPDEFIALFAAQ